MPSVQPLAAHTKMRRTPDHPKYSLMITEAIGSLKDRTGSSRHAILRYIMDNYRVGQQSLVNRHLKVALRAGVQSGQLKQTRGTGAVGSFRLGDTTRKDFQKLSRAKAAKAKRVNKTKAARRLSFSAAALGRHGGRGASPQRH